MKYMYQQRIYSYNRLSADKIQKCVGIQGIVSTYYEVQSKQSVIKHATYRLIK